MSQKAPSFVSWMHLDFPPKMLEIMASWDEIWKQKNETFEKEIADTCWAGFQERCYILGMATIACTLGLAY